jgi:perosamine synthetase
MSLPQALQMADVSLRKQSYAKGMQLNADDSARLRDIIPRAEPPMGRCGSGPRRGKIYPVAETYLVGNEREYLIECIDSNWISSRGLFVDRFERAFAREAGCSHAVACANGTAALHLVLAALGLGPGDEVILPAFTMIATPNAVHYTGATVKLVDSEPISLNIDPALIEQAITERTRAIIVVHTYGHPAQMSRLVQIANAHGLYLIEDAAEAHGAEISGKRVGSFGLAGTFSFYANKIITTGEGGMVTTNDADFERVVRRLRDHAFHPERHFWHEYVGFNYRMTNLQAAVGLAQTERIDEIIAARQRLRGWYHDRLRNCSGLRLPQQSPGVQSVFWMYGIRVDGSFGCTSHALRERLASCGIETRSFFTPIHIQPTYIDQFRGQSFPVAEDLCRSGLYLPTSEALTEEDVDWICEKIVDVQLGNSNGQGIASSS